MNTLILNSETANLSIAHLLEQIGKVGVAVKDAEGNLVAVVLGPEDSEKLTYAEAMLDLSAHRDELQNALKRKGGITTAELLAKAAALAAEQSMKQ